jgi:hypothetical protein
VIDEFNARQLSRLMWAIAKLKVDHCIELAQAVSRRAAETIHDFKPVHMSQLMWAFAKLEYFPSDDLVLAMLEHANSNIGGFLRQSHTSSNFLWAIDHLGIKADLQLVDALSGRSKLIASEIQTDKTRSEQEPSISMAAEQSQPAEIRCFIEEITPSEHEANAHGTERSLDHYLGQAIESVVPPAVYSASCDDFYNPLKRKREDADENMLVVRSYQPDVKGGSSDRPPLIQKLAENEEGAGVRIERFMTEEPSGAGDVTPSLLCPYSNSSLRSSDQFATKIYTFATNAHLICFQFLS